MFVFWACCFFAAFVAGTSITDQMRMPVIAWENLDEKDFCCLRGEIWVDGFYRHWTKTMEIVCFCLILNCSCLSFVIGIWSKRIFGLVRGSKAMLIGMVNF